MQRLFAAAFMIGLALSAVFARPAGAVTYVETPALEPLVQAGSLPAIRERLPENPLVIDVKAMGREPGRHGGEWRMLIHSNKDVKLLTVYGYARLVVYNEKFELVPDILESYTVEEGRIFTFKLRKGHKWSDGHPFTTEDFRYYWEDVANDEELSPSGPPREFVIEGEKATVEIVDEWTIRYSWSHPNPFFLPAIAGPAPLYIYRPAHYLKPFHKKYSAPASSDEKKRKAMRNWAAKHNNLDNMYKADNPDLPSLEPWVNVTKPPATRYVAKRNPYFHRVDENGNQLPYIDQLTLTIADSKLIPAKVGSGEVDLQARALNFADYTFLKEGEKRNDYTVRLWRTSSGAHLALYPNLTISDEGWRKVFRDVRFRRALSLSINRHQINQVLYYGLGVETGNSVLPQSVMHDGAYDCWCKYDPAKANALLDEMGLTQRDGDVRLLPDGRKLEIIVETAGEDTEQTDVLELVRDDWAALGIRMFTKPSQREVFRNRIFAGETQMSIWAGLENGLPTPDMNPGELAPTMQTSLKWSQWGQHYETMGQAGEAPDLPEAIELLALHEQWLNSTTTEERYKIWHRMLQIYTDNVFAIGLIAGVLQPIVVSNRLRNVPVEAIYSWDPGAHFGMHRPDTFWFDSTNQMAGN